MKTEKDPRVFERVNLSVDVIDANPLNPRKNFDDDGLRELAQSIREVGVLQPLIITESGEPGRYLLVAGERRLRAAKLIGLSHVPVKYLGISYDRDWRSKETQMALMLIENLQREDLDPIEEANAFKTLTQEHGWKQVDLAEKLGISQSHIANRIRLLVLPESVQEGISQGVVTTTEAKELATYAKVPGVNEMLDEAMADKNTADLVWNAKRCAYDSVRPLHEGGRPEPQFDTAKCVGCKEKIMMPGRWGDDREKRLPWCTNIRCWSEKQEAALHVIAERAKQQAIDAGEEVLQLDALPGSAYESLDVARFDKGECIQCEHRREGRHGWMEEGESVDICLNPECYTPKQSAFDKAEHQREKEIREGHKERKEELIAGFFPQALFDEDVDRDSPDFRALVYMTAQAIYSPPYSSSISKAKVRTAVLERYGWAEPEGLGWQQEVECLVDQLLTLTVGELLRLIYFVMMLPVERDDWVFKAVYGEGGSDGND